MRKAERKFEFGKVATIYSLDLIILSGNNKSDKGLLYEGCKHERKIKSHCG